MAALQAPAACLDAERAPRLIDAARRRAPTSGNGSIAPRRRASSIATEDPDLSRAELRADLNRMLKAISPRAREMLRLRFEDDMTQAEIGVLFGVSQMQVSRILREAIARLRCVAEHRRLGGG